MTSLNYTFCEADVLIGLCFQGRLLFSHVPSTHRTRPLPVPSL